jgi:hypothetical protein
MFRIRGSESQASSQEASQVEMEQVDSILSGWWQAAANLKIAKPHANRFGRMSQKGTKLQVPHSWWQEGKGGVAGFFMTPTVL